MIVAEAGGGCQADVVPDVPYAPLRPILLDPHPSPDSDGPVDVEGAGETLARIMEAPPSAGTAGLMELRHRWRTLSPEKRIMLVMLARKMATGEGPGR